MSDKAGILGSVDAFEGGRLFGWAWDPSLGDSPVTVEVHYQGKVLLSVLADAYRPDLARAGVGKGFHSFNVEIPRDIRRDRFGTLQIRPSGHSEELVRGTVRLVGEAVDTAEPEPPSIPPSIPGAGQATEEEQLASEISAFIRPREALARRQDVHRRAMAEFKAGVPWTLAAPHSVYFETTTECNLKCVMCPHGNGGMPAFNFNVQVLRENPGFLNGMQRVELQGVGEPLMSQSFWQLLDVLDGHPGVDISFNSNGTLLRGERLDRIVGSSLSRINVSLDAVTPETHKRIRGGNLDKVVANLRELIRKRNETPGSRLKIFSNLTLMKANIEEFPDFVTFSHSLGVDGIQVGRLSEVNWFYSFRVVKDGWTFDYEKEQLKHCRELAGAMIAEAERRAKQLGITMHFDGGKAFEF